MLGLFELPVRFIELRSEPPGVVDDRPRVVVLLEFVVGAPFMLPFSPDTTRWRRAALVELHKLGIDP